MRCVIMQPTYLPWSGYIDLIDQSDVFVFLDTVQFEKQSWQQRNKVKTANGVLWLTVPVHQCLQNRIVEVHINNSTNWQRKHWGTIDGAYRRSAHFASMESTLRPFYSGDHMLIADMNISLIRNMCDWIGVQACFVRTSELDPIDGVREQMLVSLCRRLGADEYLSPAGSRAYLADDTPFTNAGIKLRFHEYVHPVYPQLHGEFIPYLSALDLIANVGPESLEIIRSGRRDGSELSAKDTNESSSY